MNMDQKDEALLKQVKLTLEAGAQDLDPVLETRLRGIRREAVAHAGQRQSSWAWQWGGAVAATVLVAMLSFNSQDDNNSSSKIENVAGLEDLQILSSSEDLELYQDLEFYSWLDELQKTG